MLSKRCLRFLTKRKWKRHLPDFFPSAFLQNVQMIFNTCKIFFLECNKLEAEYSTQSTTFKFNKILLLQKLSKLEIEQLRRPDLSERQLEQSIRKRGIDYAEMVRHHKVNKEFQNKVHSSFEKLAVETKIVNR